MTATVPLSATARPRVGKGAARAERRAGRVPAVIYGDRQTAQPISLELHALMKQFNGGHFFTTVYEIEVDGRKNRVLPRDVQMDPVRDTPTHVDFLRLARGATIDVAVPVTFVHEDECPGIRDGGVLNVVRHEVEVTCPNDAIPDAILADLSGLELGDSLHISAIKLPENVTPTITDRDFTVATIAAPAALKAEEEEAVEEDEPSAEVPRVGEEDADGGAGDSGEA